MTKQKTGGRKPGTPNKDTKKIRESFQLLIENNLEQLQQDLKDMTGKDRVRSILELSRFILPHLKAVDSTSSVEQNIRPVIIHLGEGIDPNHI
jgi:hypothetical protein